LEAELATIALAKHPGVGYLRIDKSKATLDNEEQNFEIGKCRVLANGHDYTIFVTGSIAEVAIAAANMLKTDGISLKVIGVPSIKPIDKKTILNEITNTKGILTLEEGNIINGLGSAISDIFSEAQVYPEKFKKFGISDIYVSIVGTQDYLREYCGLTVENISNQVKQWVIES
jgi:transketolase